MNRQEFEESVYNWIETQDMLRHQDGVIAGVSGGADSVALLLFLCRIREQMQLCIRCIHVEHGIRGEDSLCDARFVEELCKELKVPCKIVSIGERIRVMTDTHMSMEEKARKVRYEIFSAEAEKLEAELHRSVCIAVAHHRNDNVETMLFHMARGTGIDGMCGMPPKRGRIVRPFLSVGREDIEAYLAECKQPYCTDGTNADTAYDRNRIRHNIIPEMKRVNERAVVHMNQAALLLREVAEYVGNQANELLRQASVVPPQVGTMGELETKCLVGQPEWLRCEVIHLWLQQHITGAKNIGSVHMHNISGLLNAQVGKQISLPCRLVVLRTYKGIAIARENDTDIQKKYIDVSLEAIDLSEEGLFFVYSDKIIKIQKKAYNRQEEIPRNLCTKWFDYDKIKHDIQIRTRQRGDRLMVSESGACKKLQDYLVNEKVPASMRDEIPLLCEGNHVIWVMGYRISEYYKIDDETRCVLEVQILEEKGNE